MESTRKTFQGHRLLLSTSALPTRLTTLRCILQLHHHHHQHTPIQFANLVSVSYGLRPFLHFPAHSRSRVSFSQITFFSFSAFSPTHIHLSINPCILSSYPHHAYCTLSLRFPLYRHQVYVTDTCSRFTTLTRVLLYNHAIPITSPASFFDSSPKPHSLLQHSLIRSSY
jgi:hypothetical protein